ncbi:hypothetical protein FYJ24_00165 [Actinomycetaceae bacterium WB03_NA08]|uniref:Uncharacterized protein n=1 Tax=Scrofimicrobium canadense TaxID=2652290 RepID=A0A6N7W1N6_9ACTO|nr:hypothetical protein [Scrofimicrobium canadense]MSS83205.1 hypothetical protein [Scrofimicrobium canadense]
MDVRATFPQGGLLGWGANLTEALNYRNNPKLYARRTLTSADLRSLKRQIVTPDPGAFSQGSMDDCYLISDLKALMSTEVGRKQIEAMVEVHRDFAVIWFWDGLRRIPVRVRSVFEAGVRRIRGPRTPLAAVIESAYAHFRWEFQGRLPTMGFSGDTLGEIAGVAVWQKRRVLGLRDTDVAAIGRARSADLPVVVSTVGSNPVEFTDAFDIRKRTFDAEAPARIPGLGDVSVRIRAAHAYMVTSVGANWVELVNPWEYNYGTDGQVLRATEGVHQGALTVRLPIFMRLFGHVGLIPSRSLALWKSHLGME